VSRKAISLQEKIALRSRALASPPVDALSVLTPVLGPAYDELLIGRFERLEAICLRWAAPDWFEFLPQSPPFRYVRASGEKVEPGAMFTDGGSIPRAAQVLKSLSPWGYAPAYLLHDWEFDLHHARRSSKSFEDVRNTMMEAVKTLMETGICPKDEQIFTLISAGITSPFARHVWENEMERAVPTG
jgi:hypothetical protein